MSNNLYVKAMQHTLSEQGVDGLLLVDPINIRYFSGIHFKHPGSAAMLLFADRPPIVYSANMDYETALNEKRVDKVRTFTWREDFHSVLTKALEDADLSAAQIGIEDAYMSVIIHANLSQALPNCRFVPFSTPIAKQRGVKSSEEIKYIRKACQFADAAMQVVIQEAKAGMTERELAILAEKTMREAGAEDRAFETIFSSGVRTAMCHGFASDKRLETGEFVMFDLGAVYRGYNSDMTRMATVGPPSAKQHTVYEALRKVYDVLLEGSGPGVQVGELVRKASAPLLDSGYADAFICGFGRGIGLTLSEEPTLVEGSDLILEPGMIIGFHPAFFFQRQFGLRLESTILITETGAEILTRTPMDLIQI